MIATTPQDKPGPELRSPDVALRPLRAEDLDAVVAIDRVGAGTHRRPYFDKRLQAALRYPKRHLQFAVTTRAGLSGFLVARIAGGEYGRSEDVVVLEALGVEGARRRAGIARTMLEGLEDRMRSRGVRTLVTQVNWQNHGMLQLLDGAGFTLSQRLVLERPVARVPLPTEDEEIEKWPPVVRHLSAEDMEVVSRIDRRITGSDRSEYFQRKFDEVLKQSAIQVSLVAEEKGEAVAFAMARVDFGDFGRIEPTASLDTIGVDPGYARKGFARAVLSQMVDNLAALHVERLETEVDRQDFDLQKFLYAFGFRTSQQLCFQKRL